MIQFVTSILDWLWLGLIAPAASKIGDTMEMAILVPMMGLGLPQVLQVMVIGGLTALLSMAIMRLLRVKEKEAWYLKEIQERKEAQKALSSIPDWKVREVLQDASDSDIDEIYNTYISKKFAWFGSTYLVPIFTMLFWLDTRPGLGNTRFLVEFHDAPMGIPGLSVPLVFFTGYFLVFFSNKIIRRFRDIKRDTTLIEIMR